MVTSDRQLVYTQYVLQLCSHMSLPLNKRLRDTCLSAWVPSFPVRWWGLGHVMSWHSSSTEMDEAHDGNWGAFGRVWLHSRHTPISLTIVMWSHYSDSHTNRCGVLIITSHLVYFGHFTTAHHCQTSHYTPSCHVTIYSHNTRMGTHDQTHLAPNRFGSCMLRDCGTAHLRCCQQLQDVVEYSKTTLAASLLHKQRCWHI